MSLAPTFTPKQLDSLKSVAKSENISQKGDAISMAIGIVGDVASGIITTLGAIKNAKLKKKLEEELQYINEQQATELENSLRATQNENDRIAKMMDFLSKMVGQQSANKILNEKLSGSVSDRKKIVYIFGGIVVLLIGVLVIKKINK
jgi:glutamyl-tRNA reductase